MSATERRAALSLASIYALRMLGLFMILPVFALYADELQGVTPALAGLAIGIYGLTQAMLQIPYGLISDRLGRKPVIIFGLLVFVLGSLVAAAAESIQVVILGRAIQGAGAIAAVVMALAADLTREQHRVKTMAIIGMSIGASFMLAMVLGPVFNNLIGVSGIFMLTAVLAVFGIVVIWKVVPNPVISRIHRDAEPVPAQFAAVLKDTQLLRLDAGILILHMILTASFVTLPLVLRDIAGFDPAQHWKLYLPVLALSVLLMIPFILLAEKYQRMKQVFLGAIVTITVALLLLFGFHQQVWVIAVLLVIFFAGFNLLEAILPSLISKLAPADSKGTAMGFYSSAQFFGAFLGGVMGGWLHGKFGLAAVFLFCAVAAMIWLVIAAGMKSPRHLSTRLIKVVVSGSREASSLADKIAQIAGVTEAVVIAEDGVAYLKVDPEKLDEQALGALAISS
jgi:predicted MFS family arabinose efflux permease